MKTKLHKPAKGFKSSTKFDILLSKTKIKYYDVFSSSNSWIFNTRWWATSENVFCINVEWTNVLVLKNYLSLIN